MTNASDQPKYVRSTLQGSRVGDDLVIFDDRVGKYFATGPVGADIWDMLEKPIIVGAICERLMADYAIDEATCLKEVNSFLDMMRERNLIAIANSA